MLGSVVIAAKVSRAGHVSEMPRRANATRTRPFGGGTQDCGDTEGMAMSEREKKLEAALRRISDLSHQRFGKVPRDKTLDAINEAARAALESK